MPDPFPFDDDQDAPGSRLSRSSVAFMRWARTETGGWILIAVLALTVVVALGLLLAAQYSAGASQGPAAGVSSPAGLPPEISSQVEGLTLSPDAIQDMTPDAARVWNATLPFSTAPNLPARPFVAPPADLSSYGRALDCLTAAVYYEAGFESDSGQAAVAQVVLNRVRHPAFPRTVCGVVFQGSERTTGCQFTFTCDGALARPPVAAAWQRSRAVAAAALNGRVMAAVGTATHYHGDYVAPTWAPKLAKIVQVQAHIFYRWAGAWGFPPAFTGVYRGGEPTIATMAALSSAVPDEAVLPETPALEIAPPDIEIVRLPALTVGPETAAAPADVAPPASPTLPTDDAVRSYRARIRAAPVAADPLANPATTSPARDRTRPRTAAPSSW